jgi:hypothetical protein
VSTVFDENGSKIVDIRVRRAGNDRVPESGEQGMRVVVREHFLGSISVRPRARDRVRTDMSAGDLFLPVDAVRIACQCMNTWMTVERDGEREQILHIAPAASRTMDGHRCFAPGEEHAGRGKGLTVSSPVIDVGVDGLAFGSGDPAGELVRIENAGGYGNEAGTDDQ